MAVTVSGITKSFGTQVAVDQLSFSLKQGEITGFLGPNGAGKSTTMKMITGLLLPDAGTIEVAGFDLDKNALDARRKIGYLPEHNPLYKDMYVREYLELVAGIHKLGKARERIDEMISLTGLEREAHKQIGMLSKGYRQRVGLAQAMIHDPDVLILDEPTSGLDPNQLKDIRSVIRAIGKEKTVLFSTHIMQEVQAICDRVIIINLGKMVADAPIDQLDQTMKGQAKLDVLFKGGIDPKRISAIEGVVQVHAGQGGHYQVVYDRSIDVRESIFHLAVKESWVILEMTSEKYSMEDIFQQLTKKA